MEFQLSSSSISTSSSAVFRFCVSSGLSLKSSERKIFSDSTNPFTLTDFPAIVVSIAHDGPAPSVVPKKNVATTSGHTLALLVLFTVLPPSPDSLEG